MQSDVTYQAHLAEILIEQVSAILKAAEPGHCLRLEGIPFEVLKAVCRGLQEQADGAKVVLLSNSPAHPYEVSATKLIELRNSAEGSHPLLVLIPSNLRTAAEDSFDRATFKQIQVGMFPEKVVEKLQERLPADKKGIFHRIKTFLDKTFDRILSSDWATYLLACEKESYADTSWGRNLFLIGLIPDRKLLADTDLLEQRLRQNIMAVQTLKDERIPLIVRINGLQIEAGTLQKFLFEFLSDEPRAEDVRKWGHRIAESPELRPLDLENWHFLDLRPPQELEVFVNLLKGKQIVREPGDSLKRIITKANRDAKVSVSFKTRPGPMEVNTLAHFRIDLMRTADQGMVETVKTLVRFKKSAGKTATRSKQVAINPLEVDQGVYFFRVLALDDAGVILNRNDTFQDPQLQEEWEQMKATEGEQASRENIPGKLTCDSEDFLFEVEEQEPDEEEEREGSLGKRQKVACLFQAGFKVRQDYLKAGQAGNMNQIKIENMLWVDQGKGKSKECVLEVQYNDVRHRYMIPMAAALRDITIQMLKAQDRLGSFRMDLTATGGAGAGETHLRDNRLALSAPRDFLKAREAVFQSILNSVQDEAGNGLGVAESCDFTAIGDAVEIYIAAYHQWMDELHSRARERMEDNLLDTIRKLQLLDHVELLVPSPTGRKDRILVLTPLHPLKLSWFLQRERLCLEWERHSNEAANPSELWNREIQNLFLEDLYPANHPLVVHGPELKSYYYAGELAPGWAAYLPVASLNPASEDKGIDRTWFGQIQNILGIPATLREMVGFSHSSLYRQIRRYLIQHPYVDVLHLNIFNPGDGKKLVECLKLLQNEKIFSSLRYEIRFFAAEDRLSTAGTAFDDFLNPSREVAEEADAFTVPSENALFPKIRFSRNSINAYQQNPDNYPAHLSFMIEVLPVDVRLERPSDSAHPSVFCFGLVVQPVHAILSSGATLLGWSHYLSVNETPALSDEDSLTGLMNRSLDKAQRLVSLTLAGRWTEDAPALSLCLNDSRRTLLYQIHQHSDWVITIDQNMGVDFYDAPGDEDCIPYLLDYSPGTESEKTPFFVTTRPDAEILGLFLPHLNRLNLIRHGEHQPILRFLELLRSVSGVIIMQSISSITKASETIGMGLSRMLLERLNVLEDQFIIPLDPHQDLFEAAKQVSEDRTGQRGDFLLISCDRAAETVHIHAVEVKCRERIGDGEALKSLMSKMTEQLDNTVTCIQHHFDPFLRIPDRLDRPMKDRRFCELLLFYLQRARRYGLIHEESFEESLKLLSRLNGKHRLTFNRIGLIFEFGGAQEEIVSTQVADDLVFFHVGEKMIQELFNSFTRSEPEKETYINSPLTPDLETLRTVVTKHHRARSRDTGHEVKPERQPAPEPSPPKKADRKKPSEVPEGLSPVPEEVSPPVEGGESEKEAPDNGEEEDVRPAQKGGDGYAGVNPSEMPVQELAEGKEEGYSESKIEVSPPPEYGDMIGESEGTPQYGLLALGPGNRKLALDLDGCNTISLFGVPGAGKSYTLGTVVEMAVKNIPSINTLPRPLAGVIFHFHESEDYPPEFVSMRSANTNPKETEALQTIYNAEPTAIEDIVLLTPSDKVEQRRQEYPEITVAPIAFSSAELSIKDWKFLMGALGNQAMYIQHLNMIMRRGRNNLSLDYIREAVEASGLSDSQKEYAGNRLELAAQFIDDAVNLRSFLRPGRIVIVDLRDEFIEKEQALGLFVVMLNIFAGAKQEDGTPFNKLIVFDEAHKYITHSDLTSHVVEVIRQMRHQGVTMLIASQDPPSLPNAVIELSSAIILHRFNSPAWLKHIQKSVVALSDLIPSQLASLQPGEAYIWANKATHTDWTKKAIKVKTRPRATLHGGSTQKAI